MCFPCPASRQIPREESNFDHGIVNEQDIAGGWQIIANSLNLLCTAHVAADARCRVIQIALSLPEHRAAKAHARQYAADAARQCRGSTSDIT